MLNETLPPIAFFCWNLIGSPALNCVWTKSNALYIISKYSPTGLHHQHLLWVLSPLFKYWIRFGDLTELVLSIQGHRVEILYVYIVLLIFVENPQAPEHTDHCASCRCLVRSCVLRAKAGYSLHFDSVLRADTELQPWASYEPQSREPTPLLLYSLVGRMEERVYKQERLLWGCVV